MSTLNDRKVEIEHIWRQSFQRELNEVLQTQLGMVARSGVKACLESALQEELSIHLGFDPYGCQIAGGKAAEKYRSGFYERIVTTAFGDIDDLRVPKLRRGNKAREWRILQRYQRCSQHLIDSLLYLYTLGLSIRDLQEALYILLGSLLSKDAINRILLQAQQAMLNWQQTSISETPAIIIIDGVWVSILYSTGESYIDRAGHQRQKRLGEDRVILAALGVWPNGDHQLLHYEVASDETDEAWSSFWNHLIDRGLSPHAVELIVSDGKAGAASIKEHLPNARIQRCVVHKIRGFERYLSYKDLPTTHPDPQNIVSEADARKKRRNEISADAHEIFKAATLAEAQQRLDAFNKKWQPIESKAVKSFNWGLKRCFEFYQFDPSLHHLIRSTNLIERFFREFRAKADEIGCFPNEMTALTIFHIVMVRDHAKHYRHDFAKTSRH